MNVDRYTGNIVIPKIVKPGFQNYFQEKIIIKILLKNTVSVKQHIFF